MCFLNRNKLLNPHTYSVMSHLIGTWVGDIDDTGSQLRLQVVDECSLKSLSLVYDIVLITSTGQSEEKAEITVPLQRRKKVHVGKTEFYGTENNLVGVRQKCTYCHSSCYTLQL